MCHENLSLYHTALMLGYDFTDSQAVNESITTLLDALITYHYGCLGEKTNSSSSEED